MSSVLGLDTNNPTITTVFGGLQNVDMARLELPSTDGDTVLFCPGASLELPT